MKKLIFNKLLRLLASHRQSRLARRLNAASIALHNAYENRNYNVNENGELFVLRRLAEVKSVSTVFDVGANLGDWSSIAMQVWPQCCVHAFEIVPETFLHLQSRFSAIGNIRLNCVGLSEREEILEVNFSPDCAHLATCVPGFSEAFHKYCPRRLSVKAIRGDSYCEDKGILKIDVLKIDVEGYEHQVLKGFRGMLEARRVDVVQFEYGFVNIDTHFLLKDFYAYLSQFDMSIGKIYPNYVEFRPYRHVDEDFLGPNYLAVRSELSELMHALQG